MKFIHYGHNHFDPEMFAPVRNRQFTNKPHGGLWASAVDAKYGWNDWCKEADFRSRENQSFFTFTISPKAHILTINSSAIANSLPERYETENEHDLRCAYPVLPDFERLKRYYDVIDFRFSEDKTLYRTLYTWDCDCVLVMNPDVIIEENSYAKKNNYA